MVNADKRGEGIPLACGVVFGLEEEGNKLGGIWYQRWGVLEDGSDGEDSILAHVCVTVFETGSGGGEERFDELGFAELAEEAKGVASDVFVRMLEVVPYAVAYQDHLLLQLPGGVELGADLVVEVEQLLEGLRFGGHDEADDVHEQLWHWVSVQHDGEDSLHGANLAVVGALLELGPQLGHAGDIGGIVLVHQAVRIVEEGGHLGRLTGSSASFPGLWHW